MPKHPIDASMATASTDSVTVALKGRLTAHTATATWRSALEMLGTHPDRPVVIDASQLEYVDTIGIALLCDLVHQKRPAGAGVVFRALPANLADLIRHFDAEALFLPLSARPHVDVLEHLGRATAGQWQYAAELLEFLSLCVRALHRAITRSTALRWPDVLDIATEVGANAVPIVLLMGFLIGVIITFEVGLVAQQFGAVIFVVNGVGKAMLRELGPLMTAIVIAGRTGSAFAAQIGTQKVNEELSALVTFGLDPIEFLVLPRLLAACLVVPLLTVLTDVMGLFGGALVMASDFRVGYVQFHSQLMSAVSVQDFVLGIAKATVFGVTIATIGCHRGMRTGAGPASVGLSTTGAVVASIVMIVVIDGLFAVATG